MKKIQVILIIALSFVFFGSGFFWESYTSKEYGFSIFLPRFWYKEIDSYGTAVMARSPLTSSSDRFRENITVTVAYIPTAMSLLTYFELNRNQVFEAMEGQEFAVKEGEISSAGEIGRWLSFSVMAKNIVLKITSAVWIKNNRAYVVTCSSQDSQYDKYEDIFQNSLRSIRFK